MSEEQLPGEEPKKNEQEGDFSSETTPESTNLPAEETVVPIEATSNTSQATGFPPSNGGFPPPPNNSGGFTPNNGGFGGMQQTLPNATIVLVLGILSILTCCCYGIIGLILGIVALVLSKKDRELYAANIGAYTESSFKNLNAGRVCAIIGLILNILYLLLCIVLVAMFGFAALSDQDAMREALQNMQ